MKHDELMAEYAPKAAQQAQERAAAHAQGKPVPSAKQRRKGKGQPVPQPIATVTVPIGTRQEVYEALELLTGGNITISSINDGKAKKKGVNNANDRQEQVSTDD